MTKKEKEIILNKYKETLDLINQGFEYKIESKRDLTNILDLLNLKKERLNIENNQKMIELEWNLIKRDTFNNLSGYFQKVDINLSFDLIEVLKDEINYLDISNDIKKCMYACYNILEI